jgi:hypothetical protein
MIEILGIKVDNGFVCSLVLCVADDAILTFIAVVSSIVRDANSDFFMTRQASGWRDFEIFVMALAAVFQSWGILMDGAQLSRSIVDIEFLLR